MEELSDDQGRSPPAQPLSFEGVVAHRQTIRSLAARHKATNVAVALEGHPRQIVQLVVDFLPGASLLDQVGLIQDVGELLGWPADVLSRRSPAGARASLVARQL